MINNRSKWYTIDDVAAAAVTADIDDYDENNWNSGNADVPFLTPATPKSPILVNKNYL